jgi:hypothetical protein
VIDLVLPRNFILGVRAFEKLAETLEQVSAIKNLIVLLATTGST